MSPHSPYARALYTSGQYSLVMMLLLLVVLYPDMALAEEPAAPEFSSKAFGIMCTIADIVINQRLGAGIASIGIISLSIAAIVGRIAWANAAMVVGGIAIIFGAGEIAVTLGATNDCGFYVHEE